jgi:hypothetical protein
LHHACCLVTSLPFERLTVLAALAGDVGALAGDEICTRSRPIGCRSGIHPARLCAVSLAGILQRDAATRYDAPAERPALERERAGRISVRFRGIPRIPPSRGRRVRSRRCPPSSTPIPSSTPNSPASTSRRRDVRSARWRCVRSGPVGYRLDRGAVRGGGDALGARSDAHHTLPIRLPRRRFVARLL